MTMGLLALKLIFNFCNIMLSYKMSETSIFNSNNKEELPDDLQLEYNSLCNEIENFCWGFFQFLMLKLKVI